MNTSTRSILFKSIGILFFVLVIIYSYSRFNRYISGPRIQSINIEEYTQTDTLSLGIEGIVENVQSMYVNGREVTITNNQEFDTVIVLSPGYTIIEITLYDSFTKERTYQYHVESSGTNPDFTETYNQAIEPIDNAENILLEELPDIPSQEEVTN